MTQLIKTTNEGKMTENQRWNMIHLGMRPGAADLFLAKPSKGYHGLFMEVKRVRGYYTPSVMRSDRWQAQEAFLKEMRDEGYAAEFVFGWEYGRRLVSDYLDLPCDLPANQFAFQWRETA